MRKLILALFAVLCLTVPVFAQTVGYFQYLNIPATDTTIPLKGYWRTIQIWTDSGSADLYVELNNNTATVGGTTTIHIAPGGSWQSPAGCNLGINSLHWIGSSASGKAIIGCYH